MIEWHQAVLGIISGMLLGVIMGISQKPWFELKNKERRGKLALMTISFLFIITGMIAFS